MLCCGDKQSAKFNHLESFPLVLSHAPSEKYSFGRKLPHVDVDCLKNFFFHQVRNFQLSNRRSPLMETILRRSLNVSSRFRKLKTKDA